MKKLSVLLLIMMMAVAAVSAEESVKKEAESTEVKSTKKLPPFYLQAGVNLGIVGSFNNLFGCSIPVAIGYKVNDKIRIESTFNFIIPETVYESKNEAFLFYTDVLYSFPNKNEGSTFSKYVGGGLGFGSYTRSWPGFDWKEPEKTGVFQIHGVAGLEKSFNEHFAVGGKLEMGLGGMFTLNAGGYAKFSL